MSSSSTFLVWPLPVGCEASVLRSDLQLIDTLHVAGWAKLHPPMGSVVQGGKSANVSWQKLALPLTARELHM